MNGGVNPGSGNEAQRVRGSESRKAAGRGEGLRWRMRWSRPAQKVGEEECHSRSREIRRHELACSYEACSALRSEQAGNIQVEPSLGGVNATPAMDVVAI